MEVDTKITYIKIILGINNDSQDQVIHTVYNYIYNNACIYCNRKSLPLEALSIIDNRVIAVMNNILGDNTSTSDSSTEESTDNTVPTGIKSITRGDTKIDYNTSALQSSSDRASSINKSQQLSNSDKSLLNRFRKIKW